MHFECDAFNVVESGVGVWCLSVGVIWSVIWILNWNSTIQSNAGSNVQKQKLINCMLKLIRLNGNAWQKGKLDIICHLWICSKCARVVLSRQHLAMAKQFNNTSHIKCIFIYLFMSLFDIAFTSKNVWIRDRGCVCFTMCEIHLRRQ